jgi:ABC-type lipoprotein release transport system permease subunit
MIIAYAWRNVWRNRTRSLAVILALATGLLGALFIAALANGMMDKWIKSAIDNELSDLQSHQQHYLITEELSSTMDQGLIEGVLRSDSNIASYSFRVKVDAMAATANNSLQVVGLGVDPAKESTVTEIHNLIEEGSYFQDQSNFKSMVVSRKMADKLKAGFGSKIILTLADSRGDIAYENFKITGIFSTTNTMFDESTLFLEKDQLAEILKLRPGQIHESAARVHHPEMLESTVALLNQQLPGIKTESWKELNPALRVTASTMDLYNYILVGVVLLALIFGIVNTMLMAILERTKEIGMLSALGLSRPKIAQMIVAETVFLCLVGAGIGNSFSFLAISYFGKRGIHFEKFAEGFESYGLSAEVFPSIGNEMYLTITLMVVLTAVFASVFPIIRAFKLDPAQAIRD